MTPAEPRSDAELLAAVAHGDADALGVLYARHHPFVFAVACRCTRNEADAADIAHEVFIDLARRAGRIVLVGRLTTYLYPAIKHAAIAAARRKRPTAVAEVPDAAAAETPASEFGPLHAAVGALPEIQREVVLLRIVDGLSVEEVALALAIAPGTVKSRLHAALAALREDPRARGYFDS